MAPGHHAIPTLLDPAELAVAGANRPAHRRPVAPWQHEQRDRPPVSLLVEDVAGTRPRQLDGRSTADPEAARLRLGHVREERELAVQPSVDVIDVARGEPEHEPAVLGGA